MKTTLNGKLAVLCSILTLSFLFASCGDIANAFSNGRDFTNAEDVKDLDEVIMGYIDPEMQVFEIDFRKADNDAAMFSSSKGLAHIHYVDPDNAKKQKVIAVNLKDGTAYEDTTYSERERYKKYTGIKVEKLGCAKIADNVNTAIQMLAADSLDYSGIGSYTIELDAKPEKIRHRFTLERRSGSGSRTVYYDEYRFEADLEGNVKQRK